MTTIERGGGHAEVPSAAHGMGYMLDSTCFQSWIPSLNISPESSHVRDGCWRPYRLGPRRGRVVRAGRGQDVAQEDGRDLVGFPPPAPAGPGG